MSKQLKIYVAGKITGNDNYKMEFEQSANLLRTIGHSVMNPAILPDGFGYEDYMHVCFAMIDVCDAVFMKSNWMESSGAKREHAYALEKGKRIIYEQTLLETVANQISLDCFEIFKPCL